MSDKGNRISQVVENRQHIIKHCRGKMFTSESLKIVALICMLIDHAGATLFPQCDILRSIGRVSFPLYAFLLAQGCKHTHSMERYLLGLGIFALISEIPYDLAFGNSINFLDQTNIFYTLFLSAACVYIYDSIKKQLLGILLGFAFPVFTIKAIKESLQGKSREQVYVVLSSVCGGAIMLIVMGLLPNT